MIDTAFDQAQARDPGHARTWVALVDGDPHQIRLLQTQAARRGATTHIVCDLDHVIEYCWLGARCLHAPDDPDAEQQVAAWVLGLLACDLDQVTGDMTTRAAELPVDRRARLNAPPVTCPATARFCPRTRLWPRDGRSPPK